MRAPKSATFIRSLWRDQPGKYFCLSSKTPAGKWVDKILPRRQLAEVNTFLREYGDGELYMCPHGFNRKRRHKSCSMDPHLLYSDLDEVDIKQLPIKPTIALETSPGRYAAYWVTDGPCSEDLNKRMSYMCSGDRSGWDRTQVLRVPFTHNHKYKENPVVRVLWRDGPRYEVQRLERMVPQLDDGKGEIGGDAAEIFKEYENSLSRWARKELIAGTPERGKRSEVLWKLQNELLEAGVSRDDAFTLLWNCPWNKFASRRDGAAQLERELSKVVDSHVTGNKAEVERKQTNKRRFLSKPMSEVEQENIDWIVRGWLARREVTILEGDPGLGKSYMMQMIAADICDGRVIPNDNPTKLEPGVVAYFDTENTASTVTKGRFDENGFKHQERFYQEEVGLSIDDDESWNDMLDNLEELKPTLVVFDTMNIYIGGADTYRSSEVQQALYRFKEIAMNMNCAVVLLRHLTKNSKEKALYRGQGSIAIAGLARIVLTVGRSPEDYDERVVACAKMNIDKMPRSVKFRIEGLPDTMTKSNRSKFEWGELCDYTADDIVSGAVPPKNNDKEIAMTWLKAELKEPQEVSKLKRMAEARGMSVTTLYRASGQLNVKKTSRGYGKHKTSYWELPTS